MGAHGAVHVHMHAALFPSAPAIFQWVGGFVPTGRRAPVRSVADRPDAARGVPDVCAAASRPRPRVAEVTQQSRAARGKGVLRCAQVCPALIVLVCRRSSVRHLAGAVHAAGRRDTVLRPLAGLHDPEGECCQVPWIPWTIF